MTAYKINDVKQAAHGNWVMLLHDLIGEEIDPAIKVWGGTQHVACPVHGGKTGDGFRLFPDANETGGGICNTCGPKRNGLDMLMWIKNITLAEAVEMVGDRLFNGVIPEIQGKPARTERTKSGFSIEGRKSLVKVWQQAVSLDSPEAEIGRAYFRNRGLAVPVDVSDIRFLQRCKYYEERRVQKAGRSYKKCIGEFPALLVWLRNSLGEPCRLLRIYMKEDGTRFHLQDNKKLHRSAACPEKEGLHIEATPFQGPYLGITEGLENARAVYGARGMPTWATWSSSVMAKFVPPPGVHTLFIWADNDPAGIRYALKAKEAITSTYGIKVHILIPPGEGDWNDLWQREGRAGFRKVRRLEGEVCHG